MRVLWFTNTPSLYQQNANSYNGGGWIESLELHIRKNSSIDLGISFFHSDTVFKAQKENVTYYPIRNKRNILKKIQYQFDSARKEKEEIQSFLRIVNDFNPDIIHIFGSEMPFGVIAKYISTPVVLHIQGILTPYLNAWFPPGYSRKDIPFLFRFNFVQIFSYLRKYKYFSYQAKQEQKRLSHIFNYMGRTEWDRRVTSILSPNSKYFHCDEILREPFYIADVWRPHQRSKLILATTISSPLYKGFDLILKTATILSSMQSLSFEWHIFGNINPKLVERMCKVKAEDVNIKLHGIASAEKLVEELLNADIFIHPSYIDNSPNSICEAQMLGLPVISTNVGGISSIIKNNKNGILVPANDPYMLTAKILELRNNKNLAIRLSEGAKYSAYKRHDRDTIVTKNLSIYQSILSKE